MPDAAPPIPKLYHLPLCPYSRKVRVALREKGLTAELIEIAPWGERADELFALNPAVEVPVLAGGGTVVSDSLAPTRIASITLVAGASVTCTFVNAVVPPPPPTTGSITIVKDADPNAAQDFGFTVTGTGLSNFSLDDDADATLSNQRTFSDLTAGSYSVTEAATTGWTLTSISCTAGGSVNGTDPRTATITLSAGANVTCVFLNTIIRGGQQGGSGGPGGGSVPNTSTSPGDFGGTTLLGVLMAVSGGALLSARAISPRRAR